ncbi:conserved Plasmodium protein, unknown function [Plasmodium malariae]|uniref:Uncharacterized protein n=1 Tax=Plasmodium malariae TaxID=5858 RepID=A0A1C3KAU7_PLAMA|nr:conserved Plasmodium protein, unknown function [Plasmodium malariae]
MMGINKSSEQQENGDDYNMSCYVAWVRSIFNSDVSINTNLLHIEAERENKKKRKISEEKGKVENKEQEYKEEDKEEQQQQKEEKGGCIKNRNKKRLRCEENEEKKRKILSEERMVTFLSSPLVAEKRKSDIKDENDDESNIFCYSDDKKSFYNNNSINSNNNNNINNNIVSNQNLKKIELFKNDSSSSCEISEIENEKELCEDMVEEGKNGVVRKAKNNVKENNEKVFGSYCHINIKVPEDTKKDITRKDKLNMVGYDILNCFMISSSDEEENDDYDDDDIDRHMNSDKSDQIYDDNHTQSKSVELIYIPFNYENLKKKIKLMRDIDIEFYNIQEKSKERGKEIISSGGILVTNSNGNKSSLYDVTNGAVISSNNIYNSNNNMKDGDDNNNNDKINSNDSNNNRNNNNINNINNINYNNNNNINYKNNNNINYNNNNNINYNNNNNINYNNNNNNNETVLKRNERINRQDVFPPKNDTHDFCFWNVENDTYITRPLYAQHLNKKHFTLLDESEEMIKNYSSNQYSIKFVPRHLLYVVSQVASRTFFDPIYRKQLLFHF